jgi:hypothetical protein
MTHPYARQDASSGFGSVVTSKLPRAATQRTLRLAIFLRFQPLHDAMHMKCVIACAPDRRAIVAGDMASRAAFFKFNAAYTADLIIWNVPPPLRHKTYPCRVAWLNNLLKKRWLLILRTFDFYNQLFLRHCFSHRTLHKTGPKWRLQIGAQLVA